MESIAIKVKNTNNELLKELHVVKYQPVSLKGLFSSFVDDFVRSQEEWNDYNSYSYQYKYKGKKFNENIVFHPIAVTDNGHCDIVNDPYEFTFEYTITNPLQKVEQVTASHNTHNGKISFHTDTNGATIWYKFCQDESYQEYLGDWVDRNNDCCEYYAYATKEGMRNSDLLNRKLQCVEPVFSENNGYITLTTITNYSQILYKRPEDTNWILYDGPFEITTSGTYSAKVIRDCMFESHIVTHDYCGIWELEESVDYLLWDEDYSYPSLFFYSINDGKTVYYMLNDSGTWLNETLPYDFIGLVSLGDKIEFYLKDGDCTSEHVVYQYPN